MRTRVYRKLPTVHGATAVRPLQRLRMEGAFAENAVHNCGFRAWSAFCC